METNRRSFLKQASMAAAAASIMQFLPESVARAMAIDPATGSSYLDAEHVVFLMQENRSFDHTFGSLQGVRGFNDPRVFIKPDGHPAWLQQDQSGKTFAPFRLNIHETRATWMSSLPHSWPNQVDARNNGRYDKWIISKASGIEDYRAMPLTLGYHTRQDIPFYYALADAFTICDQHFCSALTGTTPNRLFFWTGTIRGKEDEQPARVYNGDADYENTVAWKTFPERLEEENISWKVYQNEISAGVGFEPEAEPWLANFTDNPLEFFSQYNVKFSPEFMQNPPAARKALEEKIRDVENKMDLMPEGSADKADAQKELHQLRRQLEINLLDQQQYTPGNFAALPQNKKSIHRKAFTTNRNDPSYHELTSFTYKDGTTEREVKIPKGDVLHQFREDVDSGTLPTVSWLVAPENFSDHPSSAWYGAWYISEVMDILTKNPEVWKKTIFILTYDENDGYFDHIPPFVAPDPANKESGFCSGNVKTTSEFVSGPDQQSDQENLRNSPVGLGYRVPMVIASPWTRGGFVNSQVFDHSSSLQFLENFLTHRTGRKISEPNISEWRRIVCGDLSSAFRKYSGEKIRFPEPVNQQKFIRSIHQAQFRNTPDNFRTIDAASLRQMSESGSYRAVLPVQEPGTRPSNALPYEPYADLIFTEDRIGLNLRAGNSLAGGSTGLPFSVYSAATYQGITYSSRDYAVAAGEGIRDYWNKSMLDDGQFHLLVYGPNGFYRSFKGLAKNIPLEVQAEYITSERAGPALNFLLKNPGTNEVEILITDNAYGHKLQTIVLAPGATLSFNRVVKKQSGWYDLSLQTASSPAFEARYAGRVETGKDSITDPFMGNIKV